jgi:hypothetical protein
MKNDMADPPAPNTQSSSSVCCRINPIQSGLAGSMITKIPDICLSVPSGRALFGRLQLSPFARGGDLLFRPTKNSGPRFCRLSCPMQVPWVTCRDQLRFSGDVHRAQEPTLQLHSKRHGDPGFWRRVDDLLLRNNPDHRPQLPPPSDSPKSLKSLKSSKSSATLPLAGAMERDQNAVIDAVSSLLHLPDPKWNADTSPRMMLILRALRCKSSYSTHLRGFHVRTPQLTCLQQSWRHLLSRFYHYIVSYGEW